MYLTLVLLLELSAVLQIMELLDGIQNPSMFPSLTLPKILNFIHFAEFLCPFIEAHERDITHPPEALRLPALLILSHLTQEGPEAIQHCWKMYKQHIWASRTTVNLKSPGGYGLRQLDPQDVHLFNTHCRGFNTCEPNKSFLSYFLL